jgi:glycosyltransferase involved in cell wall biosynthesis
MKIGIVYLGRRGSGGPISIELATHLSKKTEVFAFISAYSECLKVWEETGVTLEKVNTYSSPIQAFLSYLDYARFRQISIRIQFYQPDVLIFPMFYTWNPFIQRFLKDIPTLIAVHDPVPHPGWSDFVYRHLEDWSIRQADRHLLFSRVFEKCAQTRGINPETIDYVPTGALSYYQRYSHNDERYQSQHSSILFFGRITAYKGIGVLLEAFGEITRQYPSRLYIVGEGDLRPYKKSLARFPNVEVVNRWVKDEEISMFFNKADIVVLPYTQATQSGVLDVAAAYGCAVIATRSGGLPEQIKDGKTGLLVDPGSVDQLVDGIERLLQDPGYAKGLGNSLQKDYAENRNWETIAGIVIAACKKAVEGRKSKEK